MYCIRFARRSSRSYPLNGRLATNSGFRGESAWHYSDCDRFIAQVTAASELFPLFGLLVDRPFGGALGTFGVLRPDQVIRPLSLLLNECLDELVSPRFCRETCGRVQKVSELVRALRASSLEAKRGKYRCSGAYIS